MGQSYLAKTLFGLEEVLADELRELGATNIETSTRAVKFEGDKKLMYRANLSLRTAIRVLKPIHTFKAKNEEELYKGVQEVNWSDYMLIENTFAIDGVVTSPYFNHSKYIALKSKDALVDQFRDTFGVRPNVHVEKPDLRINLYIYNDECTLSLDSSGASLHRRGYRLEHNMAPLNECLAAGMILLSGWDRKSNFVDFMCGSGTLPIEAAMIARNVAPNKLRKHYGFMTWQDYDEDLWEEAWGEARTEEVEFDHEIIGSDMLPINIDIANENAERAQMDEYIKLSSKTFTKRMPPRGDGGVVIINPPYGERMQKENMENFYKLIGDHLKTHFSGYDAWIISSNKDAMKSVGLRTSQKLTLFNSSLECKYHKYELYSGTKREK
jgi:putative N6-adenine-specific DNA methylase